MNCHMQDREDARLLERVRIFHGAGVGGDLIPPNDFVNRSPTGNGDGQQRCGKRAQESARRPESTSKAASPTPYEI